MFAPSIRAARGTAALPQAERRTRRGPGGALGNQARLRQLAPQMVQAKLEVGAADDPLEREADRVADTVMRAPVPLPGPAPDDRRIVRRKCDECEEADTVARKGAEGAASLDETAAPAPVHETLAAPGVRSIWKREDSSNHASATTFLRCESIQTRPRGTRPPRSAHAPTHLIRI